MATAVATSDTAPQHAQAAPNPGPEPAATHEATSLPRLSPTTTSSSSIATRSRFFTTSSSRPFSRSALQRQSVHTLPSIHHLQHGFAKLGLLAQADQGQPWPAPPRRTSSSGIAHPVEQAGPDEDDSDPLDALGPQPDKPVVDLRMPWERDEASARFIALKNEAQLRDEAYYALDAVCDCWSLAPRPTRISRRRPSSSSMSRNPSTSSSLPPLSPTDDPAHPLPADNLDLPLIPTLLATTTLAVRAIQAFAVSLPSTPTAAHTSSIKGAEDSLVALRRTSLAVLGTLRELEARYRMPRSAALEPDGAADDADTEQRTRAPPQDEVEPAHGPRPGAPRSAPPHPSPAPQYRNDVALSALVSEAALVEQWVRAVESELERSEVPGGGRRSSVRGGAEGKDGDDAGEGEEGEVEALPNWARETGWPDGLARAHAVMLAHASAATVEHALLNPAEDRDGFLDALSDGCLLLESFNAVLRHSAWSRPFGFVPASLIHAFPPLVSTSSSSQSAPISSGMSRTVSAASDGGEKVGATFRRAGNLGQWSAALKHRYALALGPPPFDPRLVAARKAEAGAEWRKMLSRAVESWAEAVAREAREVESERGAREVGRRASGEGLSAAAVDG